MEEFPRHLVSGRSSASFPLIDRELPSPLLLLRLPAVDSSFPSLFSCCLIVAVKQINQTFSIVPPLICPKCQSSKCLLGLIAI